MHCGSKISEALYRDIVWAVDGKYGVIRGIRLEVFIETVLPFAMSDRCVYRNVDPLFDFVRIFNTVAQCPLGNDHCDSDKGTEHQRSHEHQQLSGFDRVVAGHSSVHYSNIANSTSLNHSKFLRRI